MQARELRLVVTDPGAYGRHALLGERDLRPDHHLGYGHRARVAPAGGRLLLAKQLVRPALDGAPAFWNVGLFLVSADGTLTSLTESGLHNSADFDVTFRTDIDGDRVDELVIETEWAEGSTSRDVLVWDGAKYVTVGI